MAAAAGRGSRSRVRVAIVGGGVAGMTTAFELSRPEHAGRYDITVYQMGWRLGGKGASGRNAARADRIEEHGLHVWMGFYENAFRMLRECYAELADRRADGIRPVPERRYAGSPVPPATLFESWRDAFFPDPHVGVASPAADGTWDAWTAWFPPGEGLPGDPLTGRTNPFSLSAYLVRSILLLRTLMLSTLGALAGDTRDGRSGRRSAVDQALDRGEEAFARLTPRLLVDALARLVRVGALSTAAGLLQAMLILETMLKGRSALPGREYPLLEFIDAVAAATRRQLEDVVKIDPRLRRKTEVIDLVMTSVVGILRDDLVSHPDGLDAINDFDARDWLEKHGASHASLASPILRGLYDMAFADAEIDGRKPGLAAGQALRCALRMFYTYRGALFWRMRASLADVVFAPLYELLVARGVKFEFFHRLDAVDLDTGDPDHPYVSSLTFARQAALRPGQESYHPLVDVACAGVEGDARMPAWPARPDYAQLADDTDRDQDFESPWDRRRVGPPRVLRAGHDFHLVVLAVGLGAIRCLAGDLVARPRWRNMQTHVKTVATQAFQLWMRKDMAALGWDDPPVTLSGFSDPFDTWSDMTHVIPAENWPRGPAEPKSLAYFCGACSEIPHPADTPLWERVRQLDFARLGRRERADLLAEIRAETRKCHDVAKSNAVSFLEHHIGGLWPRAGRGGTHATGFDWSVLVDSEAPDRSRDDPGAFDSQFWTVSLNPSDRYVLTVPGSTAYRISPLDDTYANLTVAGDWTDCGFHGGCIEAAVMSGRLAAHALSGCPELKDIVGFDHP
ncbi:MAG: FAD-dependent oxidoreductase [Betaproteobacteria bacterium]|nr:FAD-dependent oxidoreductase [Betaproteobacteria bacterium]